MEVIGIALFALLLALGCWFMVRAVFARMRSRGRRADVALVLALLLTATTFGGILYLALTDSDVIPRDRQGEGTTWLLCSLQTPSRVMAMFIIAASIGIAAATPGGRPSGPLGIVSFLGGLALIWMLAGWKDFWTGPAVRRRRARLGG